MKKFMFCALLCLGLCLSSMLAKAQVIYRATPIAITAVPTVCVNQFNQDFPDKPGATWEKHTASGTVSNLDKIHFVVRFNHETRATRARYRDNGQGVSVITFLGVQIPDNIRAKAASLYPGFVLTSGERIKSVSKGQEVYRLRFRVRAAKRVAYFDEQGNELKLANLDSSLTLEDGQ
ncbi:MAG: hypothetical protein HC913_21960 [Microscillaceae bacterium]|nr:hypothetical protein [Microscillaceae bacterium]